MNETISGGTGDPYNAKEYIKNFLNRSFETDIGEYYFDNVGQRRFDLTIRKYNINGSMQKVLW